MSVCLSLYNVLQFDCLASLSAGRRDSPQSCLFSDLPLGASYLHLLSPSFFPSLICLSVALSSVLKICLVLQDHAFIIVPVFVCAAIMNYHRLGGLIDRNLFLTVLEVGKSTIKVQKDWVPGESLLPVDSHLLAVAHVACFGCLQEERGRGPCLLLFLQRH